MSGHFKQLCKICGTVMTQCRCPDNNKPTTYGTCRACLAKQEIPNVSSH